MPDISINGNNNRAAGRDYNEFRAPDICPSCEVRYLLPERQWCQHCEHEYLEGQRIERVRQLTQKKLFQILCAIFCLFMASTLILHYGPEEWTPVFGSLMFLSLFGCIGMLTACENYSKKKFYAQE